VAEPQSNGGFCRKQPKSARIGFQKSFQIILLTEMPSMRENDDGLVGASD
jgi:hypothetical protein